VVGRCIKVYRFEPHPNRKILRIVGEVTVTIVKQTFESLEVQRTEVCNLITTHSIFGMHDRKVWFNDKLVGFQEAHSSSGTK
jgi:hypothetical protein